MSNYIKSETYGRADNYNFLSSEHYHTITYQFATADGATVGDRKIVKAGTVFSKDITTYDENSSAVTTTTVLGIVFHDVDVTDGPEMGALLVGGRVFADRITATSAQKSALTAMGIFFDTYGDTTRAY
jgi:hypothetical protein